MVRWGLTVCLAYATTELSAGILHESAVMGIAGQYGGTAIASYQFTGSRFYLQESSIVTRVGGHMGSFHPSNTFLAAIIRLDGPTALPSGDPFSPEEIVVLTNFSMGAAGWPSLDLMTPLRVTIGPGWYGLVFGGGRYSEPYGGAYGEGIMPANNTNLPGASYFGWNKPFLQPTNIWQNGISAGARFVVEGSAVTSLPRITSMKLTNNRIVVTFTNLLWGFQTGVETREGRNKADWMALTNSEFVATSSWNSCTTALSNTGNSVLIRMIQR